MNKKKESSASLRGSPNCTCEKVSALRRRGSRGSPTSAAGPTFEQWKAMGWKRAAKYSAKILGLDADRERKLAQILRHEFKQPPKPANDGGKPPP